MKKMEKIMEFVIMTVMIIMIYVGFRAFWFADELVELIIGIGTMTGFGGGLLMFILKKNKLYDKES